MLLALLVKDDCKYSTVEKTIVKRFPNVQTKEVLVFGK